ncbi:hypothetical protein HPB49_013950 [Dermacentor silvarum]|uniref:Uncharacterized protein n=1 Tax=Dermacentor silvarum TaxID=543639 RepID=A0ACB8E0Q5_DERSI|nr:hypothetical protein HPB49_013950 [Dermacentor silvarum]
MLVRCARAEPRAKKPVRVLLSCSGRTSMALDPTAQDWLYRAPASLVCHCPSSHYRRQHKHQCMLSNHCPTMLLRVQLRHEVWVVSERLDETEPLNKTRAVSQPALWTVPPVLPRLPADNIKELEAAVRDEAVAATLLAVNSVPCEQPAPQEKQSDPAKDGLRLSKEAKEDSAAATNSNAPSAMETGVTTSSSKRAHIETVKLDDPNGGLNAEEPPAKAALGRRPSFRPKLNIPPDKHVADTTPNKLRTTFTRTDGVGERRHQACVAEGASVSERILQGLAQPGELSAVRSRTEDHPEWLALKKLASLKRLAAQLTECRWKCILNDLLRCTEDKKLAPHGSNVSVMGDVHIPEKIMRLLQKGPKFGVQPGVPAHDLIAMNRKVADKATDDNRDRCLLEGVDCLRKFAAKTMDSQHRHSRPPPVPLRQIPFWKVKTGKRKAERQQRKSGASPKMIDVDALVAHLQDEPQIVWLRYALPDLAEDSYYEHEQDACTFTPAVEDSADVKSSESRSVFSAYLSTIPVLTPDEREIIRKQTMGQAENNSWFHERKGRLTASIFKTAIHCQKPEGLLSDILQYRHRRPHGKHDPVCT